MKKDSRSGDSRSVGSKTKYEHLSGRLLMVVGLRAGKTKYKCPENYLAAEIATDKK